MYKWHMTRMRLVCYHVAATHVLLIITLVPLVSNDQHRPNYHLKKYTLGLLDSLIHGHIAHIAHIANHMPRPFEDSKKKGGAKRSHDETDVAGLGSLQLPLGGLGMAAASGSKPSESASKKLRVNKNARHLVA